MNSLLTGMLLSAALLPLGVFAEDWTREQQEVLAFERACVAAKTAEQLKACFHEDYVGWGMESPVPLSKEELSKIIDATFDDTTNESILFKPLSVVVKGNMAVVSYIDSGTSTNNRTDEVELYMQRWTDVCVKDGGKWYWISDHGVDISDAG